MTMRRYLKKMEIRKRSAAVKLHLNQIVRRIRRNFGNQNRNRNWNFVVFSRH